MSQLTGASSPILKKLFPILTLVYPFVLYFFQGSPYFQGIALGFGSLLILYVLSKQTRKWQGIGIMLLLILFLAMWFSGVDNSLRLYPFMMSGSMLLLFLNSENPNDNPMIGPFRERFAADPKLIPALHKAKVIWVLGLSINTLILGIFLFSLSQELWVLYASFYSYLFLLFLLVLSILFVAMSRRGWL
ncbi:MAG: hypothetical protein EOP07_20765 [Proteobacteria bacterium]|nr:MAG: hypothetical protein EOP07_20765 [Pseudomonadota bacterium]